MQRHGTGRVHAGEGCNPRVPRRVGPSRGLLGVVSGLAIAAPAQASAKLVLIPEASILIGLIVLFLGLVVVVNGLIFKPIFQALDDRASRVEGAKERAEEIDEASNTLLRRYEDSIREVRAEAESSRKNKLGHAREEQLGMAEAARGAAEARIEEAGAELEAEMVAARETLRASSREIAQAVAARVIGREL